MTDETVTILIYVSSYFDVKFTADPMKLKIPDECKQAVTHRYTDNLRREMTWAFALFEVPHASKNGDSLGLFR